MTTWDDVQAAQEDVALLERLLTTARGVRGQNAGHQGLVQELAEARALVRLRRIDYRLTCWAHPGRLEELGGPGVSW